MSLTHFFINSKSSIVDFILLLHILVFHAFQYFYYIISRHWYPYIVTRKAHLYYGGKWFMKNSCSRCYPYARWISPIIWRYKSRTRNTIWGDFLWNGSPEELSYVSWWNSRIFCNTRCKKYETKVHEDSSMENRSYFPIWYEFTVFCSEYAPRLYWSHSRSYSWAIYEGTSRIWSRDAATECSPQKNSGGNCETWRFGFLGSKICWVCWYLRALSFTIYFICRKIYVGFSRFFWEVRTFFLLW